MKFYLLREQTEKCWAFDIDNLDEMGYFDLTNGSEFQVLVFKQEKHGVLDGCGVGETGIIATGYSSYEQTPKQLRKAIHIFRDWFIAKGYVCNEVKEFKNEEDMKKG